MPSGETLILHLSDIHFRHGLSETPHDLDKDGRLELLSDISRFAEEHDLFDLVLVTGDIAFAGKDAEYDVAKEFLSVVAKYCLNGVGSVKVVPGNHDVDRSAIGTVGQMVRERLRSCPSDAINDEMRAILGDPDLSAATMRPLAAYNRFAEAYGCSISSDGWWWRYDGHALSEDVNLAITGLTTVLVCDSDDSATADNTKMVVGLRQAQLQREANVVHITLAHHPPAWWRDGDPPRDHLARAHIQLYGHLHEQRSSVVDGGLVVVAGALHPEREWGWYPRYNVLRLSVPETDDAAKTLNVELFPRRWSAPLTRFVEDRDYEAYPVVNGLPLERIASPTLIPARDTEESEDAEVEAVVVPPPSEIDLIHALVNDLTYGQQLAIFAELDLIEEGDETLDGPALRRAVLKRVRITRAIDELWNAIEQRVPSLGPRPH